MSEKAPVHVRVAHTHPDFAYHPGEITTISREKFDQYAEIGPFFEEISAKEANQASAGTETATLPDATERAVVPATTPKTPAIAAQLVGKAAKSAPKSH